MDVEVCLRVWTIPIWFRIWYIDRLLRMELWVSQKVGNFDQMDNDHLIMKNSTPWCQLRQRYNFQTKIRSGYEAGLSGCCMSEPAIWFPATPRIIFGLQLQFQVEQEREAGSRSGVCVVMTPPQPLLVSRSVWSPDSPDPTPLFRCGNQSCSWWPATDRHPSIKQRTSITGMSKLE